MSFCSLVFVAKRGVCTFGNWLCCGGLDSAQRCAPHPDFLNGSGIKMAPSWCTKGHPTPSGPKGVARRRVQNKGSGKRLGAPAGRGVPCLARGGVAAALILGSCNSLWSLGAVEDYILVIVFF